MIYAKAQWHLLFEGEHNMCHLFRIRQFYLPLRKHLINFCRDKLSFSEWRRVRCEVDRWDLLIDEVDAVFRHIDTPKVSVWNAPKLREYFQKGLIALLILVGQKQFLAIICLESFLVLLFDRFVFRHLSQAIERWFVVYSASWAVTTTLMYDWALPVTLIFNVNYL